MKIKLHAYLTNDKGEFLMPKKIVGTLLVVATMLISSVCLASLNWSYLFDCTNSLNNTTTGLGKTALACYGKTSVDFTYDAGVTVFLKELDSDGDWVTVTAWEDVDNEMACVSQDYAVGAGTYKLEVMHKAYEAGDHSEALEIHYSESVEIEIK